MARKSVFVTGGTIGSGYATAERFAKEGYDVFITSRSGERAQQAADSVAEKYGVFTKGYALDIRNEQAVKDIFADIDALDRFVETVVLNSADMGFGSDPAKGMDPFTVSLEDFQRVFETNLVWNFSIVRQAALRMRERRKGAIVFVGSVIATRPIPNRTAYIASKGGISSLSKALAIDFGPYGIRSNVVLPGTLKTERWEKMGKSRIVDGNMTPLGDIPESEDIANAAWYLGSDESRNVTGAEIVVDSGIGCQYYPRLLNDLKRRYDNDMEA